MQLTTERSGPSVTTRASSRYVAEWCRQRHRPLAAKDVISVPDRPARTGRSARSGGGRLGVPLLLGRRLGRSEAYWAEGPPRSGSRARTPVARSGRAAGRRGRRPGAERGEREEPRARGRRCVGAGDPAGDVRLSPSAHGKRGPRAGSGISPSPVKSSPASANEVSAGGRMKSDSARSSSVVARPSVRTKRRSSSKALVEALPRRPPRRRRRPRRRAR